MALLEPRFGRNSFMGRYRRYLARARLKSQWRG